MSQYLDKDGASRIAENFLSKQTEQDAILQNLQFDLKEAEHALVKTIQGPAPLNIRALTRPLDDYRISGNTVQAGTPTSSDPVDVVGCGEKTENLFPLVESKLHVGRIENDGTIDYQVGTITIDGNSVTYQADVAWRGFYTDYIQAADNVKLTLAPNVGNTLSLSCSCYNTNNEFLGKATPTYNPSAVLFTLRSGTTKVRISVAGENKKYTIQNPMLNTGSTAKPYEPYGFKLPITVNNTEYPVYLGNVQTTRRIRKLVLTGEEDGWYLERINSFGIANFVLPNALDSLQPPQLSVLNWVCSHFEPQGTLIAQTETEGVMLNVVNTAYIRISSTKASTKNNFKAYLAAQYAAGTPVTVWYVLATPETVTVNEPLHKIGNYADTITMAQSGVEISTTKGFNTITTDTTVLPSNIEVKGVINNA